MDETWLIQQGNKAIAMAEKHADVLTERLRPNLLSGLREDVSQLRARDAKVKEVRADSTVATAKQNVALRRAFEVVSAVSSSVRRRSDLTAAQRKAYAVGIKVAPKSVSSVAAAGALIAKRASENPEEARDLGMLPSEVEELRQLIAKLEQADITQEELLALRPLTTKARDQARVRAYEAIKGVAAAGVMAFASDAKLRTEFDSLDDLPKRKRKTKQT